MNVDHAVRTVSKNLALNLIGAVWQFALVIAGTKLVLHRMGAESFGILALVGGTTGYFLYLEIGIGETVVKKVSEANESRNLGTIVSTLFFFGAGFGLLLALLLALFGLFGADALFSFAPPLMASAARVFLIIAAGLWIIYPLNVFDKVFVGLNRMDVYNAQRIVFQTLILGLILAALKIHNSAESAVAAVTLGGVLWKLSSVLLIKRLYPGIRVHPSLFNWPLLKEFLRYKSYATISQASGHTVYQSGVYMVGILLDPAKVTLYSLANTLAMKVAEASGVLATAVFPVISSFYGANMAGQIRKNFLFASKAMAIGFMPVTMLIFVYAKELLTLWVGGQYAVAAPALRGLVAVWYLNSVGAISTLTIKAINRPEIEARLAAMVAAATLALDYFFIKKWGYMGAVYAAALTQFIGVALLMMLAARVLGTGHLKLHFNLLVSVILGGICGVVYLLPLPPWALPALFLVYCSLYLPACYFWVLDADERIYLKNIAAIAVRRKK